MYFSFGVTVCTFLDTYHIMFSPGEEVEEWEDERIDETRLLLLRNSGWRIPKATHLLRSATEAAVWDFP